MPTAPLSLEVGNFTPAKTGSCHAGDNPGAKLPNALGLFQVLAPQWASSG